MFSWQKCFQAFSKQHRLSFHHKCVHVELDPSTFSYKQWLFYVPHPNHHQVCLMVFLLIEWAYINIYNKENLPSYASKWNNSSNLIFAHKKNSKQPSSDTTLLGKTTKCNCSKNDLSFCVPKIGSTNNCDFFRVTGYSIFLLFLLFL